MGESISPGRKTAAPLPKMHSSKHLDFTESTGATLSFPMIPVFAWIALNGDPGIYSARYGGRRNYRTRKENLLLLEKSKPVFKDPVSRKGPIFACVLCLVGFEKEGPAVFLKELYRGTHCH